MRIQCPACDATYDLPEGAVKAGRPVRCARCATEWTPLPAPPAPDAMPPAPDLALPAREMAPAPEPSETTPPPPPSREKLPEPRPVPQERLAPAGRLPADRAVLAGWVLSVAVLLVLGWAAVAWRTEVMRAWPPSERAYAALGLTPAAR